MSTPEVKPSPEFASWLAGTLASRNSSLDTASLVDYLAGVLTADAAAGEDPEAQRESVRDIVVDFEVLSGEPPDSLAAEIVDAFNRLCVSQRPSGAAASGACELSSAEAEALARTREMTVAASGGKSGQRGSGGNVGVSDPADKQLILRAYANISSDEGDEDDLNGDIGGASSGGGASAAGPATAAGAAMIDNRAAMQSEERVRRERMKQEHAQKLERERADRDKQKKAKEVRKEAEKKRTQKQERRK